MKPKWTFKLNVTETFEPARGDEHIKRRFQQFTELLQDDGYEVELSRARKKSDKSKAKPKPQASPQKKGRAIIV